MLVPVSTDHHPFDLLASPEMIESNIRAFVQHVRHIVSLATTVYVHLATSPQHSTKTKDAYLARLLRQLFQLASIVEYGAACQMLPIELQPTGITELVIANNTQNATSNKLAMQLACRNAASLQLLALELTKLTDISPLIQQVDGNYVQYPYVRKLGLQDIAIHNISQRPLFPSAVPFPNVQHMTITAGYMLGDDTPFRGNAGLLTYLSLTLNSPTVRILKEFCVFTASSHPKLSYFKLV
ncbi:hypothetical protein GGI21_006049 [Coemansia aciculifera]|nr:hypothetical protein GGI21_006049 [Coemansia aciculifera]